MYEMVQVTWKTFNSRYGNLLSRRKSTLAFGLLMVAISFLVGLSWFQKSQADEARSTQATLRQVAVLAREINNLTWKVLQQQNLIADEIEMRGARKELDKAVLAARFHADHSCALKN